MPPSETTRDKVENSPLNNIHHIIVVEPAQLTPDADDTEHINNMGAHLAIGNKEGRWLLFPVQMCKREAQQFIGQMFIITTTRNNW